LTLERKAGEYLSEGYKLGSIIPLNDTKFVANIPEDKIRFIEEDLECNIYINSLPFRKFEIFKGRIDKISPIADSLNSAFKISIKLNKAWVDFPQRTNEKRFHLKPGLSGKAEIITKKNVRLVSLIFNKLLKK